MAAYNFVMRRFPQILLVLFGGKGMPDHAVKILIGLGELSNYSQIRRMDFHIKIKGVL